MTGKTQINQERLLLAIIILTAAFLRFWQFTAIPFMHDEFSAIFRAEFDHFSDLIKKGVMPDAHPPGVQVLLYYLIKAFGVSEPFLKFPFMLMGVGSVIFSYLVAKKWFGTAPALLTASLITVLQYNIFYSEIIRPYEPGLFFSLGMVYFWTKVVFQKNVKKSDRVWFVVFLTLNSYIHAFTILLNLMAGATGLFFVKGKQLKKYLLTGLIAFILFLPGFVLFLGQLERGDIGGWLGPPGYDFLIGYFKYIFHYSGFFFSVVIFIAFYLAYKNLNNDKEADKFRVIAVVWFFSTFFIAFFYSIYRIPVIQYSTLYFVFPFLVMYLFSYIGQVDRKLLNLAVFLILFTGISTLILEREHYRLMTRQGLNEIPKLVLEDLKNTDTKTAVVLLAPETKMYDHYFNKYGKTPAYFKLENNGELKQAMEYVKNMNAERIIIGLADYAPFTFPETIKCQYPYMVKKRTSQNMEYWILSKKPDKKTKPANESSKILSQKNDIILHANDQYKGGITLLPDSLDLDEYDILNVKAEVISDTVIPDATLVIDWKTKDNKKYFWAGSVFSDYRLPDDSTYCVTFSTRIMNFRKIPKGSKIKVYVWKRDGSTISIKKLEVYLTRMDPVEFGLFKKIH